MQKYKVNVKIGPWKVNDVFQSDEERYEALAAEGYLTKLDPWPLPVDEPEQELELWPPADDSSATQVPPVTTQSTADVVDISEWSGT